MQQSCYVFLLYFNNRYALFIDSSSGCISSCQPITWNGKIFWYVTDNISMKICTIDASGKYEEHKVNYPAAVDVYPKSIEECNVICNMIGMGNVDGDDDYAENFKYINVMFQNQILRSNKFYEFGGGGVGHIDSEDYYEVYFELI